MNKLIKRATSYLYNRDIEINERLTIFFAYIGTIAGILGVLICIYAHVPLLGILVTLVIPIAATIINVWTLLANRRDLFGPAMSLGICILLPLVYLTCGGIKSGVVAWYVYGLFFVVMSYREGKGSFFVWLCLGLQICSYIIEYFNYDRLFHFTVLRDLYVSTIGSVMVAGPSICFTIYVVFLIYNKERELANHRAAELEVLNKNLDEANRLQKAFLANMSHEIRTPINAILGMNELVAREAKDSKIREYTSNITDSGNMLLALISDILDFSRIEAGKLSLYPERYSFSNMLREVLVIIRPKVQDKGLEFVVEIDEDIPENLYGDINRVKQILLNLLGNAVKYTDFGKITLRVGSERINDKQARITFAVEDTGRGIKKADQETLFKSFERADLEVNRNIEGTGLGLAITSNVVKMMEGEVSVTSEYGQGSCFSGYVVQGVESDKKVGVFTESKQSDAKKSNGYVASFTAPQAKVLLVDDNRLNLIVERKLLEATQMQVVSVEGGAEAIEQVKQEHYDIILLDHMMPEMDGIETLHYMKEHELVNQTAVIVLTANAISGSKEKYLEAGFDDFLSKPVVGAELEKMISSYLPEDKIIKE